MLDRVRVLESTRGDRIDTAYTEAINLAKRGADAQIDAIDATKALLQVIARAYVALPAAGQDCSRLLSDFAADVPWIGGLSIVGSNDRITCSTRPNAIGLNLSDREYIAAAR